MSSTALDQKPTGSSDERVRRESAIRALLRRPELGALAGAIAVWIFFAIFAGDRGFLSARGTANYLEVSAQLGILTLAVTFLMIGGEFDLSIGSMIGASGMVTAILAVEYNMHIFAAMFISLAVALGFGAVNGLLVNRTKLPSFIITLAFLFILRGLTIGVTRLLTGVTQVRGLKDAPGYPLAEAIFASEIPIAGADFPIVIVWWLLSAAVATWVLQRTQIGNWIFGLGGDEKAARNVGVSVNRLRIGLFMATAAAAWFVAQVQVLGLGSADTRRGELRELIAITGAVIGGTLLTGGYGSAIGAVLGALIFGMVQQGIVFTGANSDWFQVFLGGMLIIAVLVNNYIRKRASEAR